MSGGTGSEPSGGGEEEKGAEKKERRRKLLLLQRPPPMLEWMAPHPSNFADFFKNEKRNGRSSPSQGHQDGEGKSLSSVMQ